MARPSLSNDPQMRIKSLSLTLAMWHFDFQIHTDSEMESQYQTTFTNCSTAEYWPCTWEYDDHLTCVVQAQKAKVRLYDKRLDGLVSYNFDCNRRSGSSPIMEKLKSRGQESVASDWTVLDYVGSSFDDIPNARVSSPSRSSRDKGHAPRSEESYYDKVHCDLRQREFRTQPTRPDSLNEQLLERPRTLCSPSTTETDRSHRRTPDCSGSRTGGKNASNSPQQRERHSDAESLRILESCTPTRCTPRKHPRKHREKSRFEALPDSQSLQMLEYWTQKRAVEKSWG